MLLLQVKNLSVAVGKIKILNNISLNLAGNKLIALLGPNGSGKSSLAQVLAGNSNYRVSGGYIKFNNHNLKNLKPEQRARLGIYLAWQNPPVISGLPIMDYLRGIYNERQKFQKRKPVTLGEFNKIIKPMAADLGLSKVLQRDFNDGFSGGEKKRLEALQMAILRPKLAIIDEIDSGLDIDSFKAIKSLIRRLNRQGTAFIIISHYTRLFSGFKPGRVLIMSQGKIVKQGSSSLLRKIDQAGFKQFT